MTVPGELVLLRHGQSTANAEGLFTGVLDVALTDTGKEEGQSAANLLEAASWKPDLVLTSELRRTIDTGHVLAPEASPIRDWRIDERNYGALTGRSKADVLQQYGPDLFRLWRRSVDTAPPPMSDLLYNDLSRTPLFQRLPPGALVRTESLRDVIDRIGGVYWDRLAPALEAGRNVLMIGHGNSLRALSAILDDLDDTEIEHLNLPTGQPLHYRFGSQMRPLRRGGRYLDETTALICADRIAREGGT